MPKLRCGWVRMYILRLPIQFYMFRSTRRHLNIHIGPKSHFGSNTPVNFLLSKKVQGDLSRVFFDILNIDMSPFEDTIVCTFPIIGLSSFPPLPLLSAFVSFFLPPPPPLSTVLRSLPPNYSPCLTNAHLPSPTIHWVAPFP